MQPDKQTVIYPTTAPVTPPPVSPVINTVPVPVNNPIWANTIPWINRITLAISLGLLLLVDTPILIIQPTLSSFFVIMVVAVAIFGVCMLEEQSLRKRLLNRPSNGQDSAILGLIIIRNIIVVLNVIPIIQLLGIAAGVFIGPIIILAEIILVVIRLKQPMEPQAYQFPTAQPASAPLLMPTPEPQSYEIRAFTPQVVSLVPLVVIGNAVIAYIVVNLLQKINILLALAVSLTFTLIVWTLTIIFAIRHLEFLKNKLPETPSKSDTSKAIVLMTLSPIIVQAIYYYGLRKHSTVVAKAYGTLGWAVAGIELLLYFAVNSAIQAILPN